MRTINKNQVMGQSWRVEGYTEWRPARMRLNVALLLSAAFVALFLSLVPLPHLDPPPAVRTTVFELDILQQQKIPTTEPVVEEQPIEETYNPLSERERTVTEAADRTASAKEATTDQAVTEPVIDWHRELERAVKDRSNYVDSPGMSPKLDELRRVAKIVYAPTKESARKPIWENVEKDQLGRTILRAGNFYRVLDDTSVANQWVFRNFTQYMIFVEYHDTVPNELPFVAQIVARRTYLQD